MRFVPSLSAAALAAVLLAAAVAPAGAGLVFQEDFSDNTAGWSLGAEWQIGSAAASGGHTGGFPDPATDFSPGGDNGVAGAILGGNVTTLLHPYYYLTSPAIDLSGATNATLRFRRWLNSDYAPFMNNTVEVYDGVAWVAIWTSGNPPAVQDNAWTEQAFDVTAHMNADFRVRFGHTVASSGAFVVSGWNLDDVVVYADCVDADADGYFSAACGGSDCDDSDPAVHPAAVEVCNGVDDDCDGTVDEGTGYVFYGDADGDGWGNSGAPLTLCDPPPPPGYVESPGDCDDGDPAIHPGAVDLCDGVDNNCNSVADDSLGNYYPDADGDGRGSPSEPPILVCSPPPGWVADASDCDDTRADVYPGAPELLDGVDNDCNGFVDDGYEAPILRSIRDVPNDQGRAVRVRWRSHAWDGPGGPTPVIAYTLYRRVDPGQSAAAAARRMAPAGRAAGTAAFPPGEWDVAATVTASGDTAYQVVVPTLCDSNATAFCRATFFVRGHFSQPWQYADSSPDSGWSVDNLVPGVPAGLIANAGAGIVELSWSASAAPDFQHFRVYRGATADFAPGPGSLVHATTATAWTDAAPGGGSVHYKVTAVDANGNESAPASAAATVDAGASFRPTVLAFAGVAPNPFGHAVSVRFDLPTPARVSLTVHDVSGRRVRTLASGSLDPGRHERVWDARDDRGRETPPGIYLLRLDAGGRTLARRVVRVP